MDNARPREARSFAKHRAWGNLRAAGGEALIFLTGPGDLRIEWLSPKIEYPG